MSITPLIQMFMLAAAALIMILCHVKAAAIPVTDRFRSGMVAMISGVQGSAWMADTFIANNKDAIVRAPSGPSPRNLAVHDRDPIFAVGGGEQQASPLGPEP